MIVLADSRANLIPYRPGPQERSYAEWHAWIGMIISGTKRLYIGNLPKKPKISASKNSSTWQPSARRLPTALKIV